MNFFENFLSPCLDLENFQKLLTNNELLTRFNVLTEQYNMLRDIEFKVQSELIFQHVIPASDNIFTESVTPINEDTKS